MSAEAEKREKIPGYEWRYVPEMDMWVPMPETWFFSWGKTTTMDIGFMISRDSIPQDVNIAFVTGLSVGVIREFSRKTKSSLRDTVMIDLLRMGDESLQAISTMATTSSPPVLSSRMLFAHKGVIAVMNKGIGEEIFSIKPFIADQMIAGNTETDTFYHIVFTAKRPEWHQLKPFSETMIRNIKFSKTF